MNDETIEKLEEITNYLRGMCLDPRLPPEFKGYILKKVAELDEITQWLMDE
jgi:hypothetical protein